MKTTMNIDTELNTLQKIRPADAPPFLFTRIEQRIASRSDSTTSVKLRFVVVSSLFVLAVLNVIAVSSFTVDRDPDTGIRHLASEMNLSSSNNLYE
ncbi:MAG: hypothetical protein KA247_09990 [Bacteroidetes bacterium]|nr:hypothetical protein [Bacteroidota bacterium]